MRLAGVAGSGPGERDETGVSLRPNVVKPGFHYVRRRRGSVPRIPLYCLRNKGTIGKAVVDRNMPGWPEAALIPLRRPVTPLNCISRSNGFRNVPAARV